MPGPPRFPHDIARGNTTRAAVRRDNGPLDLCGGGGGGTRAVSGNQPQEVLDSNRLQAFDYYCPGLIELWVFCQVVFEYQPVSIYGGFRCNQFGMVRKPAKFDKMLMDFAGTTMLF